MRPKLNLDEQEIIRLYQQGLSCRTVGRMIGISDNSVREVLKRHGIPRRQAGGHNALTIDQAQILRLREENYTIRQIAEALKVSPTTIWKRLRRE